jgi:hypothetical protein
MADWLGLVGARDQRLIDRIGRTGVSPVSIRETVWSINGLATELGMDRRTLANSLDGVPADGSLKGGRPGWYFLTVADLIDEKRRGRARGPVSRKPARADAAILGNYHDRLENWRTPERAGGGGYYR